MHEYLSILGFEIKDAVTKWAGVVVSVTFDLYGCVQCYCIPKAGKDGKIGEGCWFDIKRLQKIGRAPVMVLPNFVRMSPGKEAGAQRLTPYPGR
jgi:hypothetical protein